MNVTKRAILAKARYASKRPNLVEKAIKRNKELRRELDENSRLARRSDVNTEKYSIKKALNMLGVAGICLVVSPLTLPGHGTDLLLVLSVTLYGLSLRAL